MHRILLIRRVLCLLPGRKRWFDLNRAHSDFFGYPSGTQLKDRILLAFQVKTLYYMRFIFRR